MQQDLYGVLLVPLIVGLVEVLKRAGMPQKFGGLASLVIGLVAGFIAFPGEPQRAVIVGLAFGLSASGLYSTQKSTSEVIIEVLKNRNTNGGK